MSNELTSLNHDAQLQADLRDGKITPEEVGEAWSLTSDLSPQTPIQVRQAVIQIRKLTKDKPPEQALALAFPVFMQFMMTAMTETQAGMTRDESKFSHLVAGTETIVKTLQNINPLERRLERIESMVSSLGSSIRTALDDLKRQMEGKPEVVRVQCAWCLKSFEIPKSEYQDVPMGVILFCRPECRDAHNAGKEPDINGAKELIPDEEQEADEARRKSIGSAWAK